MILAKVVGHVVATQKCDELRGSNLLLIVSHPDGQHTGGVRSLRELMPVSRILTSALDQTPIDGAEPCRAGQSWQWDGVRFRILHPPDSGFSGDDASCVLQVVSEAGRVLLPWR